jgi:2-isopropylmalate synthase
LGKPEIIRIATRGAKLVKELVPTLPGTQVIMQYSPESFSSTEVDFALEICEAVVDLWQPTPENKIILNLPVTVEVATPNNHADQIEWFCRHLRNREAAIISLHAHNDRGTGVACTELGLLAGADRVEGTLFGNGERTGNVDIVTVALNMYAQGVDPSLDFSDISAIRAVTEKCTRLEVPIRHPYAGDLVFTAFSGSHQDAINKGMTAQDVTPGALWQVPYLPIDPKDIGRSYEAIIRINSQSGKGGVAYVMETEFGYQLPKAMHVELGKIIKNLADECGEELSGTQIFQAFEQEYLHRSEPFAFISFHGEEITEQDGSKAVACIARISVDGIVRELRGRGNGPIDAFVQALNQSDIADFKVLSYTEHALEEGAEAQAIAYIQIQISSGTTFFGAATDTNIELAAVKAVLSALNRSQQYHG